MSQPSGYYKVAQLADALLRRCGLSAGEDLLTTFARGLVSEKTGVVVIDAEALAAGDATHRREVRALLTLAPAMLVTDFPVTNSMTLVEVTGLSVPIAADQKLRIDYDLRLGDQDGSSNVKFDITAPSGAALNIFGAVTELNTFETASFYEQDLPRAFNTLTGASDLQASISVSVVNGATAGYVKFMFAQAVAVEANSALVARRSNRTVIEF